MTQAVPCCACRRCHDACDEADDFFDMLEAEEVPPGSRLGLIISEQMFCSNLYVRPGNDYVPNFTMFQKGDCNGEDEQPLFTYLKSCCPPISDVMGISGNKDTLYWKPLMVNDVRWNFEKFLVDPEGKGVKRFSSYVTPEDLESVVGDFIQSWNDSHGDDTSGARSSRATGFMSWLN
ncbi:GPX3 [Branchiostoma lanceolatum]|uniref:GPX3 protein n=1 Tax=Branchiostoma lanceolatum TaxID=7740 RepID=A0A8J9ZTF9_BRALA|nr:GPX3 [Branchiostoma lanceolatum]